MIQPAFLTTPFTILCDVAEQMPWPFTGLRADSREGYRPLLVQQRKVFLGWHQGDYTLEGAERPEWRDAPADAPGSRWRIVLERKSLDDLYGTILGRRVQFEQELQNLNEAEFAAVIVEGDWEAIRTHVMHHWTSQLLTDREIANRRKTVVRSIIAWLVRYPMVHWLPMPSREAAMIMAFRLLERWWKENLEI